MFKIYSIIILSTSLLFSESLHIERKFFPKAWSSYSVDEALEILYGEKIRFEEDNESSVVVPKLIPHSVSTAIGIQSNLSLNSISILHKGLDSLALMAYIKVPKNQTKVEYKLYLNFGLVLSAQNLKAVVVVLEDINGKFYKYENSLDFSIGGCSGEWDCSIPVYSLDISEVQVKLLGKSNRLRLGLKESIIDWKETIEESKNVPFIRRVTATRENLTILDIYLSEQIDSPPSIEFKNKEVSKGDTLKVTFEYIDGNYSSILKILE